MKDYVRLTGVAASEGIAIGPAFAYVPGELKPERENISEDVVGEELESFRNAVKAVVRKLSETADRFRESEGGGGGVIFDAHVEMAEDPELQPGVEERVRD